jgi:sugar lactone lactonase YvrE
MNSDYAFVRLFVPMILRQTARRHAVGRWLHLCLAIGVAVLSGAAADNESTLARFRSLRSDALKAVQVGNYFQADQAMTRALALYPTHAGALLLLAQIKGHEQEFDAARGLLARYAGLGFTVPLDRLKSLEPVLASPQFMPIAVRLAVNGRPIGRLTVAAQTAPEPILVNSVAFDASGGMLVGCVHAAGVFRLEPDGSLRRFSAEGATSGVFEMAADPRRGDLWVSSSKVPQSSGDPAPPSLVRLDLATGRVKARFLVEHGGARQLGSVGLGPDGTVYVSDPIGARIWRLKPGAAVLELLTGSPDLGSPHGLVVAPDGRRLIVADYSTGLHAIDLASETDTMLPTAADVSLIGVDGLTGRNGRLYAVQNGVSPARVVELTLDRGWTRVVAASVIAANRPELREPTSGVARGRTFVFVASSQWPDFGDDGSPSSANMAPAVIARVELSR